MKKNKKILITGMASLLGSYLARQLGEHHTLFGTYHKLLPPINLKKYYSNTYQFSITDISDVSKIIKKINPDVVIHLAALSNIDFCEKNERQAYSINVNGTKVLLKALANTKAHLLFLSSNAIFDGKNPQYTERSKPHPLNIYGKTKTIGEKLVQETSLMQTIIRCTSMFGWVAKGIRNNDVTYYLERLKDSKPLYLVNDRFFNPVYAKFVAEVIKKIIDEKTTGILHVAGKDRVTRYLFVQNLVRHFNIKNAPRLIPVTSAYFAKLAMRPPDGTLSIETMRSVLRMHPASLKNSLLEMKAEASTNFS